MNLLEDLSRINLAIVSPADLEINNEHKKS